VQFVGYSAGEPRHHQPQIPLQTDYGRHSPSPSPDCESFTTDQPLLDTATHIALEYATEEIALLEAAMPVLGKVE
jgi:hypothetical protein